MAARVNADMEHHNGGGDNGAGAQRFYRLPWSLHDNPIGWVEITDTCNITCKGCYRTTLAGHKSFDDIKTEIQFLERWRNINNVHLAGGEPLIHPDIVGIVRFVRDRGLNPVIITNGQRLTRELLVDLRDAGLAEMSFHVDSGQGRPGWAGRDEGELNELRQQLADLLADVGGVNCNFNMTVNPRTIHRVPEVIRWALRNKGRVSGLTFITLRGFPTEGVTFVEGGRRSTCNSASDRHGQRRRGRACPCCGGTTSTASSRGAFPRYAGRVLSRRHEDGVVGEVARRHRHLLRRGR